MSAALHTSMLSSLPLLARFRADLAALGEGDLGYIREIEVQEAQRLLGKSLDELRRRLHHWRR